MSESEELQAIAGYQLQMANLLVLANAREALLEFAISPAKLTALLMIRDNPDCEQTPLGRALSINRSSVMKLVNVLEDKGLVERRPGRDLRSNALRLTEHGALQVERMLEAVRKADVQFLSPLSPREQSEFLGLLVKLRDRGRRQPKAR